MNPFSTAAIINDMMNRTRRARRKPQDGEAIDDFCADVRARNVAAGWWTDLQTGESLVGKRNVGELLCLVHSEVSEAWEGLDNDLKDDKLPHRSMLEVELVDVLIRIFDLADGMNLGAAYMVVDPTLWPGCSNYQIAIDLNHVHRAISTAMEGHRKKKMNPDYPELSMMAMGLAEVVVRVLHIGHKLSLDLDGAYVEKLAYNASRLDHKIENRRAVGGKAY